VIVPPLQTVGVTADAPTLQTAEAAVAVPPPSIVGAVEEVAGAAEPSSTQPAITAEEEAPALGQPAMAPQERDAPEGTTRDASPEIQESGESSGAALPRDVRGSDARVLELARVCGRPPSRSAKMPRTTRRPRVQHPRARVGMGVPRI
jgi:hypothetical protein